MQYFSFRLFLYCLIIFFYRVSLQTFGDNLRSEEHIQVFSVCSCLKAVCAKRICKQSGGRCWDQRWKHEAAVALSQQSVLFFFSFINLFVCLCFSWRPEIYFSRQPVASSDNRRHVLTSCRSVSRWASEKNNTSMNLTISMFYTSLLLFHQSDVSVAPFLNIISFKAQTNIICLNETF